MEQRHCTFRNIPRDTRSDEKPMQLTLRQVAQLFNVSENTVTRWVKEENLPAHDVRSVYRFDRAELLEWATTTHHTFSPEIFRWINGDLVHTISLSHAMERGGVAQQVGGNDRYEVFRNVVNGFKLPCPIDTDNLLEVLLSREKSGGTGIGGGIAIPHPRYPVVVPGGESVIRTCFLTRPLEYPSPDGLPVAILFLMVCSTAHEHLHLLARLVTVLRSESFLATLRTCPTTESLVAAVRDEEKVFTTLPEVHPS
jgi:PTS system nitrogen regulatory IIA component